MNRKLFIITVVLILVFIILVIFSYLVRRSNTQLTNNESISQTPSAGSPTPVVFPTGLSKGKAIQNIPTLQPTKGYGLDLNSKEAQNSTNEINKIKNKLPYNKSITSASNVTIDIMIPPYELLDNDSILLVNILGPDYQISETDPDYAKTKDAFRQAALDVFFWLKENGVDTEKIIIKWGDREFIQKRSVEWLQ